ncbi:MAG: hypothetical protein QOJ84_4318 [Bradyrhizobium sp.]|nr:hypothetical protein [Bradyrhizobium sp.]
MRCRTGGLGRAVGVAIRRETKQLVFRKFHNRMEASSNTVAMFLLLIGSLLTGVGFILLLPPFEGFDETAHYSYLQQISQTGTFPRRDDPISAEIEKYLDVAPVALSVQAKWTYKSFFNSSPDTIDAGRKLLERRYRDQQWVAGSATNWQGQHPPLYYALLAPLYRISSEWSLKAQLSLLRFASYAVAWAGLLLIVLSHRRSDPSRDGAGLFALGAALWPALFPMWFPEMARLGNDCLVLLCSSVALILIRRLLRTDAFRDYLGLGAICGLGLLSKATFLPFCAAVTLVLGVRAAVLWPKRLRQAPAKLVAFAGVIMAIAGWWYVGNILAHGSPLGSNDEVGLAKSEGLAKGLAVHFSVLEFIRGLALTTLSFFWAGTWSFMQPPLIAKAPLLLVGICIIAGYVIYQRRAKVGYIDSIAMLSLAFFIIGLMYLLLISGATKAVFVIGAWYLHSLAPVFSGIAGKGLWQALRHPRISPFVVLVMACAFAFLPFVLAIQALYFSGCAQMMPAKPYYFNFPTISECGFQTVWGNLSILTYPAAALCFVIPGWIAMTVGAFATARSIRASANHTVPA